MNDYPHLMRFTPVACDALGYPTHVQPLLRAGHVPAPGAAKRLTGDDIVAIACAPRSESASVSTLCLATALMADDGALRRIVLRSATGTETTFLATRWDVARLRDVLAGWEALETSDEQASFEMHFSGTHGRRVTFDGSSFRLVSSSDGSALPAPRTIDELCTQLDEAMRWARQEAA